MSFFKKAVLGSAVTAAMGLASTASADVLNELVKDGTIYGNFNLRYEAVDIDKAAPNSDDALTLRTWLGFKSGTYNGFSTLIEFEDVRPVFGQAEHNNMIADPKGSQTELDQAYVQYKNDSVTAKVGRQVITLDNHRHVGHVAWRQDKQTFDAARVIYTPAKDVKIDLSYVTQVNRINSEAFADIETANYVLLNASYKTPVGKLVGYYYDLSEEAYPAGNNPNRKFDGTETTGFSFNGKTKGDVSFLYGFEYAIQDNQTANLETDYLLMEGGISAAGITAKVSYEETGSDTSATGTTKNFTTPLSTIHKFNGWADVFLGGGLFGGIDGGNGIEDTYFTLAGKVGGVKLTGVYHDYESSAGSKDLGSEFNFLAVKPLNKTYTVAFKYADYSASSEFGSDKEVLWAWVNAKF